MYDVLAAVNKKTVSMGAKSLFVCAIAFSNSKSAGFLRPRKMKDALMRSLLLLDLDLVVL